MSLNPSIFISWSGEMSRIVAEKLRNWLPVLVSTPEYWISSRDISDGGRWMTELSKRLEDSNFGILVITEENCLAPWLIFEAGALSKNILKGKIIPFLVNIDKNKLVGPLSQFQALSTNKDEVLRLVEAVANTTEKPVQKDVLKKRFEMAWEDLSSVIDEVKKLKTSQNNRNTPEQETHNELSVLRKELAEQTILIRGLVKSNTEIGVYAKSNTAFENNEASMIEMVGNWRAYENGSHYYTRIIQGRLYTAYCYMHNNELTAEFYNWKKLGDYWFSRFRWFHRNTNGFAFFEFQDKDQLQGKWWLDPVEPLKISSFDDLDGPTKEKGVLCTWVKDDYLLTPPWAEKYFDSIKNNRQ